MADIRLWGAGPPLSGDATPLPPRSVVLSGPRTRARVAIGTVATGFVGGVAMSLGELVGHAPGHFGRAPERTQIALLDIGGQAVERLGQVVLIGMRVFAHIVVELGQDVGTGPEQLGSG